MIDIFNQQDWLDYFSFYYIYNGPIDSSRRSYSGCASSDDKRDGEINLNSDEDISNPSLHLNWSNHLSN